MNDYELLLAGLPQPEREKALQLLVSAGIGSTDPLVAVLSILRTCERYDPPSVLAIKEDSARLLSLAVRLERAHLSNLAILGLATAIVSFSLGAILF